MAEELVPDFRSASGLWVKTLSKDKYKRVTIMARCFNGLGERTYLGTFKTPKSAHSAYCQFKEQTAKSLARYYHGIVDQRVCFSLEQFKVSDE